MRLKGKTAIVTGGASGFGAGIARKFAAEGAQVMVADLNFEVAHEIATEIGGIAQLCKSELFDVCVCCFCNLIFDGPRGLQDAV